MYSVTLLLVIHGLKSKLKPQETTFTSPFFKDQVWCKIADLYIGVCYRSINYSIVGPDNNDNMYQLLHEVSKEHFLLMGDFNFPDVNLAQSCCE